MRYTRQFFSVLCCFAIVEMACSCMEPVVLKSYLPDTVPYVQCILEADSLVQHLYLSYVTKEGEPVVSVPDAEVSLLRFSRTHVDSIEWVGDFKLQSGDKWEMYLADSIRPSDKYRLQVILPSLDTLTATTLIPGDFVTNLNQNSPDYHKIIDSYRPYSVLLGCDTLNKLTRSHFTLHHSADAEVIGEAPLYTLWVWKMDWNEQTASYEQASTLAMEQEDWADPFNLTGDTFDSIGNSLIRNSFPMLSGKPLHYKYLRIPVGLASFESDFYLAGDFKGPHYWNQMTGPTDALMPPVFDEIFPLIKRERGPKGYLVFQFVSDEVDHIYREIFQEQMRSDLGDLMPIYRNTNFYSNIKSSTIPCTGIFGAIYETHYWWSYFQE